MDLLLRSNYAFEWLYLKHCICVTKNLKVKTKIRLLCNFNHSSITFQFGLRFVNYLDNFTLSLSIVQFTYKTWYRPRIMIRLLLHTFLIVMQKLAITNEKIGYLILKLSQNVNTFLVYTGLYLFCQSPYAWYSLYLQDKYFDT